MSSVRPIHPARRRIGGEILRLPHGVGDAHLGRSITWAVARETPASHDRGRDMRVG